jgi:hypothetical protein
MAFLNWPVNRPKLTSHGQALPTDCSGRAFEVNGPSFRHTSVRGVRFFSRYPCGMPARGSITGQVRPKRRSAPYPFILEALAPLEPEVRAMFSGFAVYVGEKIVLMLRDSPKQPEDNGVWLVFSVTANLADPGIRKDFPSIRLIKLLGGKIAHWRLIPADSATFESEALHACELLLKHDVRFGRIPQSRQTRPAKQRRK